MKVKKIDLLNKIVNGEEPPKRIKKDGTEYEYDKDFQYYKNCKSLGSLSFQINTINDEIEIIEEPKKIEKLDYKYVNLYGNKSQHRHSEYDIIDKLNEIIDYINKGDSNDC